MSSTVVIEPGRPEPASDSGGRVRLLPDGLINKIAAGEVVERPASVVKELLENSVDAGATRVEVRVEDGGRGSIVVLDDGEGMTRSDALMALERHATSKLRNDADLFCIRSLGFRGEALPSIAEVSRFELITGIEGDTVGTRLVLDGGVWGAIEDAPNPGGTEIRVRRLFFNTPVRLKFLKTPRTEMHHVLDVVQRIALSHPTMAVKLVSDGRTVLDTPAGQELSERVRRVLGKATQQGAVPIAAREGALRLEGLISGPQLHRSGRASLFLFVNGRFVRDRTVVGAVLSSYREVLPKGRYPVAVLFLDLPPEDVDVNVHPAKVEVRFKDNSEIWRFVASAVSRLLENMASGGGRQEGLFAGDEGGGGRTSPSPTVSAPVPPSSSPVDAVVAFRDPRTQRAARAIARARPAVGGTALKRLVLDPLAIAATPPSGLAVPPVGAPWRVRLARRSSSVSPWGDAGRPDFAYGSLQGRFGRWVLWSLGEDLFLIDPSAAHRRLVFSNLRQGGSDSALESRRLLVPGLFETDEARVETLLQSEELLARRGLEVSNFGGGTLALHGGPVGLEPSRLNSAVELLLQRDLDAGGLAEEDLFYELDAAVSWYSGPGDEFPFPSDLQVALVSQLDTVDEAFACPYGHPTYARLSRSEAERWFRAGK